MLVRPLDANGDMMPIHSLSQMVGGGDAVAQVIHLRLDLEHGEWWEDETLGFRAPEFLIRGVRRGEIDMLAKYIASYVSSTQEVRAVTNVVTASTGHDLVFSCAAILESGGSTTVEVDLSGIL